MAPLISKITQSLGFGSSLDRKRRAGGAKNFISQSLYVFFSGAGGTSQPYTFPSPFQQASSVTSVVFGGIGRGGAGATGAFLDAGGGGGGGAANLDYTLPAPETTTDITTNGLTFSFPTGNGTSTAVLRTNNSASLFSVNNGYSSASPSGATAGAPNGGTGGSGGARDGGGSPGGPGATGGGGGGFGRGNGDSAGPGSAGGIGSPIPVNPAWSANFNVGRTGGTGSSGETGGNGGRGGGITLSAPIPTPGTFGGGGGGGGASGQFDPINGPAQPGAIIMYITAVVPEP